jgi:proteasome accessory factor C
MDRFNRIYRLHRILAERTTPISRQALEERLECSRATVRRTIDEFRDFLGAPIAYDRRRNGYYYEQRDGEVYELPGLWLNSAELFALLVSEKLLAEVQPGLLEPALAPLRDRIGRILRHHRLGHPQMEQRIRILQMAARPTSLEHFQKVATALLDRRRLRILYRSRSRDELSERIVSPQRLVYYRDHWYLDAWCHLRRGLRSFSLDRLHPVAILDSAARDIADELLKEHFTSAYGIFAGHAAKTAVLRFTSNAAKWVADEQWHPRQSGKMLPSGEYELRVPYGNPTELIMDILKYGEDVEVMAPADLRRAVAAKLRAAAGRYRKVDPRPRERLHRA